MLVGSHLRRQFGSVRGTAYGAGLFTPALQYHAWRDAGREKNRFTGGAMAVNAAVPFGYLSPDMWLMPLRSGGISASTLNGLGLLAGSPAGGRNGTAALSGSGDLSGTGQLVSSAVAAIIGSGLVSSADAKAYLLAAATLAGSGDLTAASVAIGHAAAAMTGEGVFTETANATGALSASIQLAASEALTAGSVAAAVWDTPQGRFLYAVGHNKVITDPAAGTYTVFDADDSTVLYTADLWEDAAGTVAYSGSGAQRRDRLA